MFNCSYKGLFRIATAILSAASSPISLSFSSRIFSDDKDFKALQIFSALGTVKVQLDRSSFSSESVVSNSLETVVVFDQ